MSSNVTNVIIHEIDGQGVQPNTNDANVRIILRQNTKDPNKAPVIKTNSWSFSHDVADLFNARVTNGGSGMTEGPVYTQKIKDKNSTIEFYNAYLDLQGENVLWSCEAIENIEGVLLGQSKWLYEVSKALYFQDLDLEDKYIQVPYVINTIPNYTEAAIATITAFVVLDKMNDISKEIFKILADILSILGAIGAMIKIVIVIAWAIIVLAQIIVFITDIFDHLIQPIKYHAGMLWKELLEIGFKEIGLGFQSTIFDDEFNASLLIMPAKPQSAEDINNQFALGFTVPDSTKTNGEYQKGFNSLIEATLTYFRAEFEIIDDVFIMEKKGDAVVDPVYELPDLPNLPTDPHRTNLKQDYNSNYELFFKDDLSEENTIDNYEGTRTHAITRPKDVENQHAVIGGNHVRVPLEFARASRKEDFTVVEKRIDLLFKEHSSAVNDVINASNKIIVARNSILRAVKKAIKKLKIVGINIPFNPRPIPQLTAVNPMEIPNRFGMMKLSKDFFLEDKLLAVDIGSTPLFNKIREDNAEKVHSEYVYNNYHSGQSLEVTEESPTGNQFFIYKHDAFQLCKEGAEEIFKNKHIFTHGKRETAEVVSCDWFAETGIGEIEIKIPALITDNYRTKLITPDGL